MSVIDAVKSYSSNPLAIFKNVMYRSCLTPSKAKHIFVVGAPRSGTTLLQSVLSAHDYISGFDEETGFFMYRDLFKNRFSQITDERYNEIISSSRDIVSLFDLVSEEHLKTVSRAFLFIEKTPQHVLYLHKLVELYPNSLFINMFRDVRDATVSAMAFKEIEQGDSLKRYVSYWKRCVNARLSVNSDKVMNLRYENFVTNPEDELQKVMDFIGIEYSVGQLDPNNYSKNARAGSSGFEKLMKPICSESVGRWRRELARKDADLIGRLAKRELIEIGYEV